MRNLNDYFISHFVRNVFIKRSGKRLLDLGCGRQPYGIYYRDQVEQIVTADYRPRMYVSVEADAQRLPFANDTFDFIVFSEVIEHLPSPELAIAELARCLKPGGSLILTWPFCYHLHEVPHDYMRYTEYGIRRLLSSHGFKIDLLQKRGDAFALLTLIVLSLVSATLSVLPRTPLLGPLFRFLLPPIEYLISFLHWIVFYAERNSDRLQASTSGLEHRDPMENLALWTAGYCCLARKI